MTFSLVFPLKMDILDFMIISETRVGTPLYFLLFANYMSRQVTYIKNRES